MNLRILAHRLRNLFRKRRLEQDLADEFTFHLESEIEWHVRRGLTPQQAKQAALRNFGGVDQAKERYRDTRGFPRFESFVQDLRFAGRSLRRNPWISLAAMSCLGFGIAINSTVFSLADELFLRELPLADPASVVRIERTGSDMASNWTDYQTLERSTADQFTGITAIDNMPTALDTEGISRMIVAQAVTGNFAKVLRLDTQLGRWFTPADDVAGAPSVIVLSDHIWAERFNRNPAAIGSTVRIETEQYRVIGIAAREFQGVTPPVLAEAWVPFQSVPFCRERVQTNGRLLRVMLAGRLRRPTDAGRAQMLLQAIDAQLPSAEDSDRGRLIVTRAAGVSGAETRRMAAPVTAILWFIGMLVLAIACLNVANLMLAQSAARQRETLTRRALGATKARLILQQLMEGVVLAAASTVIGLGLGYFGNRALLRWLPTIPEASQLGLHLDTNWRVVAASCTIALICSVAVSLAPAIEQAGLNIAASLRGGDFSQQHIRKHDALIVAQVCCSLTLVITALLFVRALDQTRRIDPGFAMDHRLTARIYISEPEYTPSTGRAFFDRLLAEVRAMPGVSSATLSYGLPLSGLANRDCVSIADQNRVRTGSDTVVPGYFATLGIPLMAGRDFTPLDREGAPTAVIVNQALADRFWPGRNAVGQTVSLGCDDRPSAAQVVGVAANSSHDQLGAANRPLVYRAHAQGWIGSWR